MNNSDGAWIFYSWNASYSLSFTSEWEWMEPLKGKPVSTQWKKKSDGKRVKRHKKVITNLKYSYKRKKGIKRNNGDKVNCSPHTESTQHDATRSPPPLYPMWSQIRLSRVGVSMLPRTLSRSMLPAHWVDACYPAHWVDAFRATPIESNDAVTKCRLLHFWCDMWPFCEPIMCVK